MAHRRPSAQSPTEANMKKTIFSLIIAFVLMETAFPNEFRQFTNQAGKSILARIIQYDAEGARVQLELRNHKKAWIQLSDLSETDLAYLREYIMEQAREASSEKLSKKELRTIGEEYIAAWEAGDFEAVRAFFLQPENITQSTFNEYNKIIMKFNITKAGDDYIRLEARRRKGEMWRHFTDIQPDFDERWLLFSADGKIKYDSILSKHPIHIAQNSVYALLSTISLTGDNFSEKTQSELASLGYNPAKTERLIYSYLEQTGIPLFGLDLSESKKKIRNSLFRIMHWLQNKGDRWDSSEPNVFFPRELLRE